MLNFREHRKEIGIFSGEVRGEQRHRPKHHQQACELCRARLLVGLGQSEHAAGIATSECKRPKRDINLSRYSLRCLRLRQHLNNGKFNGPRRCHSLRYHYEYRPKKTTSETHPYLLKSISALANKNCAPGTSVLKQEGTLDNTSRSTVTFNLEAVECWIPSIWPAIDWTRP